MQSTTENYKLAAGFYLFSWILDAFDGFTARYFNQCSKFGWVLDMVIDKTSTACLSSYHCESKAKPKGGLPLTLTRLDVVSI